MAIITCIDWTDTDDYRRAWAPTNDPRIIAVIERDEYATFEQNLDGDAIVPVFLIDRGQAHHTGGYQDDESLANLIVEARDRFRYAAGYRYNGLSSHHIAKADAMLARWAWIFHGTTVHRGNYGYQSAYDVLIMNTPAFREHVQAGEYAEVRTQSMDEIRAEAQAWTDSMTSEVQAIADGEVYGIGYGTLDVLPEDMESEPTLDDYDVQIEVWGFVGERYAKESAAAFEAGQPTLPEMLEVG